MFNRRSITVAALALSSLLIGGAALAGVGVDGATEAEVETPAGGSAIDASVETTVAASTDTTAPTTSTTSASTTTTSTTSTTMATVATATAEVTTHVVADAGSVTVSFDGSALTIVSIEAGDEWQVETEAGAGTEVEVSFRTATRRVDFEAEIEDGAVKVKVEERLLDALGLDVSADADFEADVAIDIAPFTIDADPAGSLVVEVVDGMIVLVDVQVNAGWEFDYSIDDGELEAEFTDGTGEVEVDVELDDGEIEVEVDVEIEAGIGIGISDDD